MALAHHDSRDDQHALPRPPRFTLRGLLVGFVGLSALFAAAQWIGLFWTTILVWTLLLGAAHVFGNRWGSQSFRSSGTPHETPRQRIEAPRVARIDPDSIRLRKSIRGGLGRWLGVATGAAAVGLAGGTTFSIFFWRDATPAGVMVAYLSCGLVGAIAGFAATGLLQVFLIPAPPADACIAEPKPAVDC